MRGRIDAPLEDCLKWPDAPANIAAARVFMGKPALMHELAVSELEVWRGDHCACMDWSARLEAGQLLHLRGGNGAGKTSLLRVLAGLATPDKGAIELGEYKWRPRSVEYREQLRYVAHRDGVKTELTARENLRLAVRLLAEGQPGDVEEALAGVGLEALADRRVAEFSAGQRRRLALARLLQGRAHLWLLDEPLVALDRDGVGLVTELIRRHLGEGGIAAVATHQVLPLAGVKALQVDLPQVHHVH
ncbi:MAG: heme ABC exporter ATP-binding protein CcmA [Gammaproteobacteria bacterium]|nr:heme ABC exporter ATP-binding protein CcmA [Gammaproteobacteria bacterium]